jgi:phospholipid transport system substrate-binding protein
MPHTTRPNLTEEVGMERVKFSLTAWLAVLLLVASCGWARAGDPTESIRDAIDRGVDALKNAKLSDSKERTQTVERLRPIVYPLFDFKEMAMRSLGSHWRTIDAQQQKEFVAVFTQLLEKTYADQIELYNGQQVIYTGESVDGDYAVVDTKLVAKDKQKYSVDYRMHKVDGKWRIYDVVAEDLSLVNNYRSQFHRTILKSSFAALLQTMKQKAN